MISLLKINSLFSSVTTATTPTWFRVASLTYSWCSTATAFFCSHDYSPYFFLLFTFVFFGLVFFVDSCPHFGKSFFFVCHD